MKPKNEQCGPNREQLRRSFGHYITNIGIASSVISLGGVIISTLARYAPLEAPFAITLLGSGIVAGGGLIMEAWSDPEQRGYPFLDTVRADQLIEELPNDSPSEAV